MIAFVNEHVLTIERDELHFQVYIHSDHSALVTLSHGLIIGSHNLACIDPQTMPTTQE